MTMIQRSYTVRFLTPAFLGNAEQNGEWRTPPFKALLRQWWRVAYAAKHEFKVDIARMRHEEGLLFGHAWLENDVDDRGREVAARHSSLRLRLDRWDAGTQRGVAPEKSSAEMKYVAWGLIGRGAGVADRTALKDAVSSSTEGNATLRLACPEDAVEMIETAVVLAHHFGTLGSRSRNGWGSLEFQGAPQASGLLELADAHCDALERCISRPWAAALLGSDGHALIWESAREYGSWGEAMLGISTVKKELRRTLTLDPRNLSERHILGLPVKDSDPAGDKDVRMPSPIRFKVIRRDGRLAFRIVAMPHALPDAEGLDSEKPKPGRSRGGLQRAQFKSVAEKAWPRIVDWLSKPEVSNVRRLTDR
ncbi:MAG: RAMP superfamily CRISPR-associated protein [Pseudomonadota bacterium]